MNAHSTIHLSFFLNIKMNEHSFNKTIFQKKDSSLGKTDKRAMILEGAAEAFARQGFFESRISDVAKAAGVADGTIYLYFQNKNELLKTLFEDSVQLMISEAEKHLTRVKDPVEQLKGVLRLHLELLEQRPNHAIVLQIELRQGLKNSERFSKEVLERYLKIIKKIIQEGQQAGLLKKGMRASLLANMFFGILDELATKWVLADLSYPLTRDLDQVTAFFLSGILTSP